MAPRGRRPTWRVWWSMAVALELLGHPQVVIGGERRPAPRAKPFWLLAYLACADGWVEREKLGVLFWPDTDPASARRNLRQLIQRARRYPFTQAVEAGPDLIRWPVESDFDAFRRSLGRGDWAGAVALYRGDLLQGLEPERGTGIEAWLAVERESLASSWQHAAVNWSAQLEGEADHERAATLLHAVLARDPLAENVLQRYLRNAYLAGDRDAALRAYRGFVADLDADIGLAPLPETTELAQAIGRATEGLGAVAEARVPAAIPLHVLRPPRLIGRETALERIASTAEPLVLVGGEPGVGKSRLLEEVAHGALRLRCREGLERVPYHPVTEVIRGRLPAWGAPTHLGPYAADLARLVPEAAPTLPPTVDDTPADAARLLEALARYLEDAAADGQPFGLLVDDLQWADPATLELLTYLSGRPGLRIVAAYRDDEVGPNLQRLVDRHGLRSRLTLAPLPPHELRRLLAELIGSDEGPERFSRWLHASTGGNPLFALETLKSMFESGVLRADDRRWSSAVDGLSDDYGALEVPAADELIGRRIARLARKTVRVLQAAAVVREGFTPRLLDRITGVSEWAAMEALEEAEGAGIVQGDGFRHDLIRQSVYRSLPANRRALLHGAAARALAEDAPSAPAVERVVVADHWLAAGEPTRAVALWLDGAAALDALSLIAEADELLERALGHAASMREATEIKIRLVASYREAGRYTESQRLVDEVLAEDLEPHSRAHALIEQAYLHLNATRLAPAAAAADEAAAAGEALHPAFEIDLAKLRSNVAFRSGRYESAISLLEPIVARLRREPEGRDLAGLLTSIGAAYDSLERHAEAVPLHRESLRIAEAIGSRYYQVDAASNLLHSLRRLGRAHEGLAAAEAALQLGRYQGSDYLRNSLALAYAALGRSEDAARLDEQLARHSENPVLRLLGCTRWARASFEAGRGLDGSQALAEAIDLMPAIAAASVRAGVVALALRWGDEAQRTSVAPFVQPLLEGDLPPDLRRELTDAITPAPTRTQA
jgi:DNA-binding SARP family transcriptional activator/tetratricopeptide (TPR) repeat protein